MKNLNTYLENLSLIGVLFVSLGSFFILVTPPIAIMIGVLHLNNPTDLSQSSLQTEEKALTTQPVQETKIIPVIPKEKIEPIKSEQKEPEPAFADRCYTAFRENNEDELYSCDNICTVNNSDFCRMYRKRRIERLEAATQSGQMDSEPNSAGGHTKVESDKEFYNNQDEYTKEGLKAFCDGNVDYSDGWCDKIKNE